MKFADDLILQINDFQCSSFQEQTFVCERDAVPTAVK